MRLLPFFLLTFAPLCSAASNTLSASDTHTAQLIVQQVDRYRMPANSFEASVRITPVQNGKEQEPGTYLIKGANHNQVLVEATSIDQRGQKFLTTDNGLFFYAPRTKRAIRLTPLQTLRGKASIGDLARISFEQDYNAIQTEVPESYCQASSCTALLLSSKNDAATYTKIILLVTKQQGRYLPLKALMHVASGKLLKVASFEAASGGLPPTTLYSDPNDPSDITRVVFEKIKAVDFPANTFNPRTLEQ